MKFIKGILPISILLFSSHSFGNGAGCGLGSTLFSGASGGLMHVVAQITNASFSNTSSMTTGTFGCDTSTSLAKLNNPEFIKEARYIDDNFDSMLSNLSNGNGEALDNFLSMKNVSDSDRDGVAQVLKSNFDNIYSSSNTDSLTVAVKINEILENTYNQYAI